MVDRRMVIMKRLIIHILLIAIIALPATISKGAERDKGKVSDYLFAGGYRAFRDGDYADAARIFRKVTHQAILYDYSLYYLGESLFELSDYLGAEGAFKRLVDLKDESRLKDDAELRLAEIYLLKGDYGGAESILNALIERGTGEMPTVLSLLGRVYRARGEVERAFKTYLALWRDYPDSPPAYGIEDSLRSIRRLYKGASVTPMDRFKRIESLIRVSMLKEARDELEMLERMFEFRDDDWMGRLARIHFRLGDMEGAGLWYKRLLLATSRDDLKQEALFRLARISLRRKAIRPAYGLFKTLYRRYPDGDYAVSALLNMALIDGLKGDRASAINTLKKAIIEYPESPLKPYLLWQVAWFSYRMGRYREATAYLNILKDYDSYHDLATFWLAKTAIEMGEKDKGIGMLVSLSQTQPPTYYTVMADVILKRHNHRARSPRISDREADDMVDRSPIFKKARLLLSFGFSGLARGEVLSIVEKGRGLGPSEIMEAAYLLQRSGDYYDALTMVAGQGGFDDIGTWRLAYPLGYRDAVTRESRASGIDPFLVYAVIREESSFDPESISSSNAIGLMQILPSTAQDIADRLGFAGFDRLEDLKGPAKNIRLGVRYLASLLKHFHGDIPLSLAAYNGGAGNVRRWLDERKGLKIEEFIEDIPFGETRRYVKKVLRAYAIYKQIYSNDEVALKLTTEYRSID